MILLGLLGASCSKVPIYDVQASFALADAAWFEEEETLFVFYEVTAEQGLSDRSLIEITYVTDDERVVIDVNVPVIQEADVIRTRNGRIKYSYLKLACPPVGAPILQHMDGQLLYVNLHYNGESFIEAACPKEGRAGFFQG